MRDDIVNSNADKGGEVIMLDMKDYLKKWKRQLNKIKNYKHLHKYSTATNNEFLHNVIKIFENETLIRNNIAEVLKINSPQTPRIYTQPKTNKK